MKYIKNIPLIKDKTKKDIILTEEDIIKAVNESMKDYKEPVFNSKEEAEEFDRLMKKQFKHTPVKIK